MKKRALLSVCVSLAICSVAMAEEAVTQEKPIVGTIEKTVESPFTLSGWALGKTANVVKASIKSPIRAAGYIVTVPGTITNATLKAIGEASEAPGKIAQTVLYTVGDSVSEAAACPIHAVRDIVESPRDTGKRLETRVFD